MATRVQVLKSPVLAGCFELNNTNRTNVAATDGVVWQVEADNLSRVVNDSINLVCTQVVKDALCVVTE